jgi:hypothetical protein
VEILKRAAAIFALAARAGRCNAAQTRALAATSTRQAAAEHPRHQKIMKSFY